VFPNLRVISIARRDHLRQAVSWVRALQTFSWRSDHTRQARPLEFDAEHITRKLGRIAREEDAWRALFDRYGIEPHEIVYEDLVADQNRTIREALAFIGVEPPADLQAAQPTLERQADALSDQWVERYIAETAHT
jgi:LPS sulfotransferase NodH